MSTKKITYLLGAGASYNAIPVVNDLACSMKTEFDGIQEQLNRISQDKKLLEMIPILSPKLIEDFKKDCEWLLKESARHQSVDTFAKKLYLQRNRSTLLKKLKIILTIYFHLVQQGKSPDVRYDSFLAATLSDNLLLPSNLTILSWNYDYQLEKAYFEYIESDSYDMCNQMLQIISKNSDPYQEIKEGFSMIKLNGTASSMLNTKESRKYDYVKNTTDKLNDSILCSYLSDYQNIVHHTDYKDNLIPSLSFAWEDDKTGKSIIDRAKAAAADSNILVVIGYSFPVFNRKADKEIISAMINLEKVYFQAPDAADLKERFLAIKSDLKDENLLVRTDVKQFLIPNEFEL